MMMRSRTLLVLGILLIVLGVVLKYMPNKEESEVPAPLSNPDWKTYTDDSVTFRYPGELPTTYIRPVSWPPQVAANESTLSCVAGRSERGETTEVQIEGRTYCLTAQSEGAAGSIYIDYTYQVQMEVKTASLSFTLRRTQCANYDDPQKTECEQERTTFSPDDLADEILQTVEFK